MKKKNLSRSIKRISILLLMIIIIFGTETNCFAASKIVSFDGVNFLHADKLTKAAKALGLKQKRNRLFSIYYSGKKIIIGRNPRVENSSRKMLYIKNTGNKKLRFYGVKIGDSRSAVRKKMKKSPYRDVLNNGTAFGPPYLGFRLKYKNNKLVSWTYVYTYT